MPPGELLTRWTVRLAVACYVGRGLLDLSRKPAERPARLARGLWTAGCGLYLLHVVCAFRFFHHWSHAAAWHATARQTRETVGLDWGGGLYVNYAFTLLWLGDVVAWWRIGPDYPRRYRRVYLAVQAVFAFLMFNATVVFGPPFWQGVTVGVAVLVVLALLWRSAP